MKRGRLWSLAGEVTEIDESIPLDGWSDFAVSTAAGAPICRIERGTAVELYGVESVYADHPVAHILQAEHAVLLGDGMLHRMTLCGDGEGANRLLPAALCARLSLCGAVLLHGALAELPMLGGVLFIGDSGVGKSTQAALWARHRGGRVLNGDRVFLRTPDADGRTVGYGSPWGGPGECRLSASTEVSVIFALTRGRETVARPLSPDAAPAALLRRTMVPGWDAAMAAMAAAAVETVGCIAAAVPMVSLCVPVGNPAAALAIGDLWSEKGGLYE